MPLFWPFKRKKRIFATIDLGSNAVRLLVVKYKKSGEYFSFDKLRRPLRLGLDVFQTGEISIATMNHAVATFKEFKDLIESYGVGKTRAVATSALREASNQEEFVTRIREEAGISIEIISGLEEARLIAHAVEKVTDTSQGQSLLLDIGGGSLELILTSWGQEQFRVSFPMGTLRTLEKLKSFAPMELKAHYQEMLAPLKKQAQQLGGVGQILGTGGNVGRFASLIGETLPPGKVGKELGLIRREKLEALSSQFLNLGVEGIMRDFGLSRDRADVAYPASMVLNLVMDTFAVDQIRVPFVELSDGLVYSLIDAYYQNKYRKARKKVNAKMRQTIQVFQNIEAKIDQSYFKQFILEVAHFPKQGIMFKDVTPLFESPQAFARLTGSLGEAVVASKANKIVGIDARGFIVGASLSQQTQVGLVLARKPGKLPRRTVKVEYELEYGAGSLEITEGSLKPGEKVFIVDDLLATGGTVEAAMQIAEKMGAIVVGVGFIIELTFLAGRKKLSDVPVVSLVKY